MFETRCEICLRKIIFYFKEYVCYHVQHSKLFESIFQQLFVLWNLNYTTNMLGLLLCFKKWFTVLCPWRK